MSSRKSRKLIIVWENGDSQKVEYGADIGLNFFENSYITFKDQDNKIVRSLNMSKAREVYFQE